MSLCRAGLGARHPLRSVSEQLPIAPPHSRQHHATLLSRDLSRHVQAGAHERTPCRRPDTPEGAPQRRAPPRPDSVHWQQACCVASSSLTHHAGAASEGLLPVHLPRRWSRHPQGTYRPPLMRPTSSAPRERRSHHAIAPASPRAIAARRAARELADPSSSSKVRKQASAVAAPTPRLSLLGTTRSPPLEPAPPATRSTRRARAAPGGAGSSGGSAGSCGLRERVGQQNARWSGCEPGGTVPQSAASQASPPAPTRCSSRPALRGPHTLDHDLAFGPRPQASTHPPSAFTRFPCLRPLPVPSPSSCAFALFLCSPLLAHRPPPSCPAPSRAGDRGAPSTGCGRRPWPA